jgi:hypothetical protein
MARLEFFRFRERGRIRTPGKTTGTAECFSDLKGAGLSHSAQLRGTSGLLQGRQAGNGFLPLQAGVGSMEIAKLLWQLQKQADHDFKTPPPKLNKFLQFLKNSKKQRKRERNERLFHERWNRAFNCTPCTWKSTRIWGGGGVNTKYRSQVRGVLARVLDLRSAFVEGRERRGGGRTSSCKND